MRDGGPNAPENPNPARVSTTRQGVMPTKVRGLGAVGVAASGCNSARLGCQYSGAGQWRRGTLSRCGWAVSTIGTTAKKEINPATMGVFMVQLSPVFWGSGYLKHEGFGKQGLDAKNTPNNGGGSAITFSEVHLPFLNCLHACTSTWIYSAFRNLCQTTWFLHAGSGTCKLCDCVALMGLF